MRFAALACRGFSRCGAAEKTHYSARETRAEREPGTIGNVPTGAAKSRAAVSRLSETKQARSAWVIMDIAKSPDKRCA